MQSVFSYYCNQLMVNMCSVCGRYYKPVACCCTGVQQCPVGLDEEVEPDKLASYASVHCHHQLASTYSSLLVKNISKPEKNQLDLHGGSTKRDQPSSSSDINNKETVKDDLGDHIQQCRQVGQDELVIAASSYNWYSHDYIHTIVCRYCREEVNSCYYEDHLVSCLVSYKYGQGDCLVVDKMVQVTERQVTSKDDFVVNCVAVQETYTHI